MSEDVVRSLVEGKNPSINEAEDHYMIRRENEFGIRVAAELDCYKMSYNMAMTGFLPWLPFLLVSFVLHQPMRYYAPGGAYAVVFGTLVLILAVSATKLKVLERVSHIFSGKK